MGLSFVNPSDTRRLDVGDGDWLEVRNRITYGAAERLRAVSLKSMATDAGQTKIELDMSTYNIERMAAYIIDWSARKPDGGKLPPTRDSFAALEEPAAEAVNAALDRHIERLTSEREQSGGDPTARPTEPPLLDVVSSV